MTWASGLNILVQATARAACRDWGLSRASAESRGPGRGGTHRPRVALGRRRLTAAPPRPPTWWRSDPWPVTPASFAALQARLLGLTVLDTYVHAVSGFAATMTPAVRNGCWRPTRWWLPSSPTGRIRATAQVRPERHRPRPRRHEHDGVDRRRRPAPDRRERGRARHRDRHLAIPTSTWPAGTRAPRAAATTTTTGTAPTPPASSAPSTTGRASSASPPGARMFGVKVLDDDANGTTRELLCGIEWVTSTRTDNDPRNDIDVANLSLGGVGTDDGNCGKSRQRHPPPGGLQVGGGGRDLRRGRRQRARGRLAASSPPPTTRSSPSRPWPTPTAGRAATAARRTCRADEDDTLANFSNYGSVVDIIAPGRVHLLHDAEGQHASATARLRHPDGHVVRRSPRGRRRRPVDQQAPRRLAGPGPQRPHRRRQLRLGRPATTPTATKEPLVDVSSF